MRIQPPRKPQSHPDRNLDCQEALERSFQDLLDLAVEAGWSRQEAMQALIELTNAHLAMDEANEITEAQILSTRSSKH